MKTSCAILAIPLGFLALTGSPNISRAQDGTAPRPYVVKDQTVSTVPNRPLLHSGIWILGLSYVPAVIVAAESNREGDKRLYIPVAGPWLDLASRSNCPSNVGCSNETSNKVFIVIDGVFQALGAFNIVGAFVFPETRTVTVGSSERSATSVSSLSVHLRPIKIGANYGVAAVGTF